MQINSQYYLEANLFMTPQLSIIIPSYNVQDYLNLCLDSVLKQHFDEGQVEVLIIDDGSTDATPTIADYWAKQELYIRAIHQPNQGLSAARNTGIKEARGEYLLFLDSDDLLVEDTIKNLLTIALDNQLDALRFQCAFIENGKTIGQTQRWDSPNQTLLSGPQFLAGQHQIRCFAWLYIVNRKFVNDYALSFVPQLLYEDVEWTPRMLANAQRMMVVDTVAYQYIQRQNSITHSYSKQKVQRLLSAHKQIVQHLVQQRKKYPYTWYNKIIWGICESALTLVGKYNYEDRQEVLDWVQNTLHTIPLYKYGATTSEKVKNLVISISPKAYCWLRHSL